MRRLAILLALAMTGCVTPTFDQGVHQFEGSPADGNMRTDDRVTFLGFVLKF